MTKAEIENCEQTERQKHDEEVRELCSNCNKPMWRYTYINGSYLYCSFCHLRKDFVRKNNLGRTSLGVQDCKGGKE